MPRQTDGVVKDISDQQDKNNGNRYLVVSNEGEHGKITIFGHSAPKSIVIAAEKGNAFAGGHESVALSPRSDGTLKVMISGSEILPNPSVRGDDWVTTVDNLFQLANEALEKGMGRTQASVIASFANDLAEMVPAKVVQESQNYSPSSAGNASKSAGRNH